MTPSEEMAQLYRNVFGSGEGRRVLGDMLAKGHYGVTLDPDNPVMVAEYNLVLVFATLAGLFDTLYSQLGLGMAPPQ